MRHVTDSRPELEATQPEVARVSIDPDSPPSDPGPDSRPPEYRVLDPDYSRNRHFDWYQSAEGRPVRVLRRTIQGLLADLKRAGPDEPIHADVDPASGDVWIELFIPRYRATRRALLHGPEFEALKTHPLIGPRLVQRGQPT